MKATASIATANPQLLNIRVLTVNLPWAGWFFRPHPQFGLKTIENRSWRSSYRGPLWVHANKWQQRPPDGSELGMFSEEETQSFWDDQWINSIQAGSIIGCVEVVASGDQRDFEEVYDKIAGQSRRNMNPAQQELIDNLPGDVEAREWRWWANDGGIVVREPRILLKPVTGISGKLNIWQTQISPRALTLGEVVDQPEPDKPLKRRKIRKD